MPNPSIPARGALGIRKEASFASGGGIDNWQVIESASFDKTNNHVFQDRIRNSPEQIAGRFAQTFMTGNITFPVSPNSPNQWWECGIGGTGPYTPQLPLSSMAMELQEGDVAAVYSSGDAISRLELSSRKGDILRCSISFEGKDLSGRPATTIPSTAYPSGDDAFLHTECTFTFDGVVNQQVESFSVSKENSLITDLFANNATRRSIPATKAVVTGNVELLFEDTTQRNRFFNRLPSAIVANYVRGGDSFKIELNKVVYSNSSRPLEGQTSFILESLSFTAYVDDPTAENSLKVTVV
jgi:hypothetical protein